MKRVILIAALVSGTAIAGEFDLPSIEQMNSRQSVTILPVAPVSRTGPTTVCQSGNYTYIEEPQGQTQVYQSGNFTYITPPKGPQTTCQTIGKFTYCN